MQLSPITSYHLRKLLRQRSDRLQPLATIAFSQPPQYTDASLDAVWQNLCQQQSEVGVIVQKLEGLVSLHQALEKQGSMYSKDLASVEETIFQTLGFRMANDMPPISP
ncbi:MAG: hypothetical protein F6K09_11650 [Merismopedia sp. SIO2A8]|nr:hypothetical protein [Merismopedia sp. SIO2A8]